MCNSREQRRYPQVSIEESERGRRVLVFPRGEDPKYSENTGFVEVRDSDDEASLQFDLRNILSENEKDGPMLIEQEVLVKLLIEARDKRE